MSPDDTDSIGEAVHSEFDTTESDIDNVFSDQSPASPAVSIPVSLSFILYVRYLRFLGCIAFIVEHMESGNSILSNHVMRDFIVYVVSEFFFF